MKGAACVSVLLLALGAPAQAADIKVMTVAAEAELALNQLSELVRVAGVEIVGPLPGELQNTIVFSAAVMEGALEPAAAKALVDFLLTPDAAAVLKSKGLEPAVP